MTPNNWRKKYIMINNRGNSILFKVTAAAVPMLCIIMLSCSGKRDETVVSHYFTKKPATKVFQVVDYWDFGKCSSYVGRGWSPPRKDKNREHFVLSQENRAYLDLYIVEKKDLSVTMRCAPIKPDNRQRNIRISLNWKPLAAIVIKPGAGLTSYSFDIPAKYQELGQNALTFVFTDTKGDIIKSGRHRDIAIKLYDISFNSDSNKEYIFNDCAQGRVTHLAYISRFTLAGDKKIGIAQLPKSAVVFDNCFIPSNSFLKFNLGFHPRVKKRDLDVTFSVFVNENIPGKEADGRSIFTETLNLNSAKDNSWKAFEVDLSEFAGKVVSFSFNIRADVDPYTVLAMWGEPRIVSRQTVPKYNVVLITMDALRADHVDCFGYHKKLTPNIDRFSKDAVIYTGCYSPVPWTLPSFASIYTSLYPQTHRVKENERKSNTPEYTPLGARFPTPPIFFKPYGFITQLITWHPFFDDSHGLPRYFDYRDKDDVNGHTPFYNDTIRKWVKFLETGTFFLHIHIIPPHSPYIAASPYDEALIDFSKPFLKNKTFNLYYSPTITGFAKWGKGTKDLSARAHVSELYKANLALSDEFFGEIIHQLKEAGLYNDSLIIFTSDHGEQFWEHGMLGHGHTLYAEELHVPLLIKFPGDFGIPSGKVKSIVSTIDILPTALEVNDIPAPGYFHGRTLFSRRDRKLETVSREYFYLSQAMPNFLYEGIMWHDYKYIFSPVKKTEELYNISKDPFEKNNIAAEKPNVLKKLRKALQQYQEIVGSKVGPKSKQKGKGKKKHSKKDVEKLKALGYL